MTAPTLWIRRARQAWGTTLTAVLVLAVGIAVNVVVYQCVDRLVLDPLPLPHPERIVVIGSEMPRISRPLRFFEPLSAPELLDVMRSSRALEAFLPFDLNSVRMRAGDFPSRLFGAFVWADPVPLLGVEPQLGRSFTREEIQSATRVALLSQAAWTREFGGDPSVVGTTVELDGEPYDVVGVLPPYASVYGVDVWVPNRDRMEDLPRDRRQFNLLARLSGSGTAEEANADLDAVAQSVEQTWARESDEYVAWSLQARSFARSSASSYADEALLTMVACLLVLVLVCINLGNLTLVRGVRDRPQTATRLALGSSWARIAGDAAGEASLLGATGGAVGVLLTWGALALMRQWLPAVLQPSGPPLGLEVSGLAFALGVTAGAVLLLVASAILARGGTTPRDVLGGSRGAGGSRRLRLTQRGLVALQLALGLALCSGAGAVGLSAARVALENTGFADDELVSMRISLPADEYRGDAVPLFFESLQEAVAALPGARGASMATQVAPNTIFSAELDVEGADPSVDSRPRLHHTIVGDDYFQTMGIPLARGRAPDARDVPGGTPVAVLNQAAAARLFPGMDALGKHLRVRGNRFDSGWATVVGISQDVRNQGRGSATVPEVFTAHRQAGDRYRQMFLIIRATDDPPSLVPAIRREVLRMDPAQPVYSIGTPEGYMRQQAAPRRTAAYLLLALAVAAVGLAALGLHGVMAYAVATRQGEFSIRASLGADPRRLRGMIVGEAAVTTLAGLLAGTLLTAWMGWILRASLGLEMQGSAPVVLASAAVLVGAASSAVLRPAVAVARADPAEALRRGG